MLYRARRIRGGDTIRRMVRETRIDVAFKCRGKSGVTLWYT